MNGPTGIQLILIGIGAFILIRIVMGGYAKAFERDRKLGRFILAPFSNDVERNSDDENYTAKDKMYITAGILLQITLLIIFIIIIDR
jgi:hypothetical protein